MSAPTEQPKSNGVTPDSPPGFVPRGDSEMDRLAAALHRQGSHDLDGQHYAPRDVQASQDPPPPADTPPVEAPTPAAEPGPVEPAAPVAEPDEAPAQEAPSEEDPTRTPEIPEGDPAPDAGEEGGGAAGLLSALVDPDAQVEITVDGEARTLPLREVVGDLSLEDLANGYNWQQANTQRSQALADERRQFDEQRNEAAQLLQQRVGELDQLARALQAEWQRNAPNPQEMEALRTSDPAEWAARSREEDQRRQLIGLVSAQQQRVEADLRAQRRPIELRALQEKMPETFGAWETTGQKNYSTLGAWITSPEGGGLPPEMWNETDDHRVIRLAQLAFERAEQLRAARDAKPRIRQRLKTAPRVIRPRAPAEPGQSEREGEAAAMANLKANPESTDAIAAAFLARSRRRQTEGR